MFCKKCGNRISDSDVTCPACGAAVDRRGGLSILHTTSDAARTPRIPAEDDLTATVQLPSLDAVLPVQSKPAMPAEPAESAGADDFLSDPAQWQTQTVGDDLSPQEMQTAQAQPAVAPIDARKEKRSRWLLKGFVCLLAVGMIALTVIARVTDLFTKEQDLVTEIPYSSFTAGEKESFQAFFSPLASALSTKTIDVRTLDQNALLTLLRPWDPAGLYAGSFETVARRVEPQDPRGRYPAGYYAVPEENIAQIASALGVLYIGGYNTDACYSYDGLLYFDATDSSVGQKRELTDVSSTRLQNGAFDGWYNVTCSYSDGGTSYCLASYDRENEAHPWTLGYLFADVPDLEHLGAEDIEQRGLAYEMRQEFAEAKTTNGLTYAKYALICPTFSDAENAVAQELNATYDSIYESSYVAKYQKSGSADTTDQRYAEYTSEGYDPALLPAYVYRICSVSYNKNGWISLLDETVTYQPKTYAREKQEAELAGEPWETLPTAQEEISTFTKNVTTGEVLHTEDLLGAEDETVWALLRDAYTAAAGETEEADDLETLGRQLYAAPWVLTEDGVTFFFGAQGADHLTRFTIAYRNLPTGIAKNF